MACVEIVDNKPIFKLREAKEKINIDVDYEMALTDACVEQGGFNETQMPISEADFSLWIRGTRPVKAGLSVKLRLVGVKRNVATRLMAVPFLI